MARTFEDQLDSFAEAWRPEPGDKLIGTVVELDVRDGEYGAYPVITIADVNGQEWAVHGFHAVLKSELARQKPEVGEKIGIAYHGERTSGANRYRLYKVRVDREAAGGGSTPDWDAMAAETDRELGQAETSAAAAAAPAPAPAAQPAVDDIPF